MQFYSISRGAEQSVFSVSLRKSRAYLKFKEGTKFAELTNHSSVPSVGAKDYYC